MAGHREGSSPTSADQDLLAEATRVAAAHDLVGMFGHLSYYPEHSGDRYLLSPGAGFQKQKCTGHDVSDLAFGDE